MQIQLFKYEEENHFNNLRAVEIDGEFWFVAADVCALLDIQNVTQALSSLDDDEKLPYVIDRAGQKRTVNLVNESGLYALVFKSKKPSAKKIRKWVTSEVLPAIRKTGSYTAGINRLEKSDFVIRYMENFDHVEKGYFSVINQLYIELDLRLQHLGYIIPNKGLDGRKIRPDVSVGLRFSTYLQEKYPELAENYKYYPHNFPDIKREFDARQYPKTMLHIFSEFIEDEWIPKYAQDYFKKKDLKALDYLPKLLRAS